MQFGPHQDSLVVQRELEQLCRSVPVDEVLLFMYGEELCDGHPTLDQVRQWLNALRPWKAMLLEMGVRVSLNPWTIFGVCDRGRRLKPGQNWQTMVDWRGGQCRAVACPLDAAWQAYYKETISLMAAEKFRVIWIEDDFRYHNHEPLDWGGCFCDLHVAEFNRRAGARASREEIVAAVLQAGAPHPWRRVWLDMWQETALELLDQCRQIAAAHGTKLGLMSSGIDIHSMEGRRWRDYWRAMAGPDQPPIHRPHFWSYGDTEGKNALAHSIAALDQNRRLEPPGAEVGPEIENFPYYDWNKSHTQTAAQMFLAQVFGSTNLNVSLYDFMGNLPSDDPSRAEFLRRLKPALSRLGDLFPPTLQSTGVGVVWREDASRKLHTTGNINWPDMECHSRDWVQALTVSGYAFALADQQNVNALAGTMAWALEDDEIASLLTRGLILDAPAAEILDQRGFGPKIGLTDVRLASHEEITYSMEQFIDAEFSLRAGSLASLNVGPPRIIQGKPVGGAKVVSRVLDATLRELGPGVTLFENALGGRVAIVPYPVGQMGLWSLHRVMQIRRVLAWLSRGRETGHVTAPAWTVPQFLTDGKLFRAAIWNAGFDSVESFELHAPTDWPELRKGLQFDARGNVTEFAASQGKIKLPHPLRQFEVAILY
jgi:hypothetical protein